MNEQNRSDSLLEMARGAILERVDYEAARDRPAVGADGALRLLRAPDPDGAHAWAAALVGQDGDTTGGG